MIKWFTPIIFILLLIAGFDSRALPQYTKTATPVVTSNLYSWGTQGAAPLAYRRTQMIYQSGGFLPTLPSGNITKLYFKYGNVNSTYTTTYINPVIRLGQTTATGLPTTFITALTTVWSPATFTIPPGTSGTWFEIPISTAYPYLTTQNLVVDISFDSVYNSGGTGGLSTFMDQTATGASTKLYSTAPGSPTGIPYDQLQELGVDVAPAACTSPPIAGNATVSAAGPVCPSTLFTLNVTGNTSGSGQTYQWQSSTSATTGYTNATTASTTSSTTQTTAVSRYYRVVVTCSGMSDTSTPVLVTVASLMSGTYTINAGAPASVTNFQSFNSAVAAMSCGINGPVIFNVVPGSGPYTERVVIPEINGASNINTITFNGNNDTLKYTGIDTATWATLLLDGADYVTIQNVNVKALGTTYGIAIQMRGDANRNTINNCGIYADPLATTMTGGIILNNNGTLFSAPDGCSCDSVTISSNRINGGVNGIIIAGGSSYVNDNKIINNTITDFYERGIGVILNKRTLIEGNDISRPTRIASAIIHCIRSEASGGLTISKNRVHNSRVNNVFQAGIYISSYTPVAAQCIISNNLVYDLKGQGTAYGIATAGSDSCKVYHNTVFIDTITATGFGGFFAGLTVTNPNSTIKNNIIHLGTGIGLRYCMAFSTVAPSVVSNNNDLLADLANGNAYVVYFGVSATNYTTLAPWQAASGQDLASVSIDPVYTNTATGNLTPTAILLNNLGAPVGINTDIVGTARSATTPDIGAYEFSGINCLSTVSITPSSITSSSATLNWTTASSVSGYEYVLDQSSSNPATNGTATPLTTYSASSLLPLTTYYFHVRTVCSAGGYGPWTTISFTTLCVPPAAVITVSGATQFCTGNSVVLTANTGTGLTWQWQLGGVNIPGATSVSYTATAGGNYTLVVSNGGCNTTSSVVALTMVPRPTATITAAGPISFCQGGSVTINANSGTGLSYQWLRNGTIVAGAVAGNYTANTSGAYRAIVSNGTCADTSNTINVTVNAFPSATIAANGPTAFCENEQVRLQAAINPVFTYQWYRNGLIIAGATSYFYDATLAGSYTVVISNSGCTSTSNAIVVTVYPLPIATAYATGRTLFCNTGSVFIQGTIGTGLTYQWLLNGTIIPGATLNGYTANQAGNYSVVVSNSNCRDTSVSVPLVFNFHPSPVIVNNSGVLSTTATFPTYQWYRNSVIIPFANTNTYTPTQNGTYVVVVTDTNGCTGTSNDITFTGLAVPGLQGADIIIYPNPATDIVYIKSGIPVELTLMAADGSTIFTQHNNGQLDVSKLACGIYTLKLTDKNGRLIKVVKLVKVQ